MPVYCLQTDDGVAQPVVRVLAQNTAHLSDTALLARKAESAARYGWAVTWTSGTTVTATKTRGIDAPRACVRRFWIGDA